MKTALVMLCACAAALVPSSSAALQAPELRDRLPQQAAVLAANTAAGALTAGVRALIERRDFSRAFARGALGGALGYAGKRIAVERWTGAPFLGRAIGAAGSSIVLNATGSGAVLDSISIPVGPLVLGFARTRGLRPRVVVIVADVVITAQALAKSDLHLDWERTLSVGAPVFKTAISRIMRDGKRKNGVTIGRLIILDGTQPALEDQVFSHEVVHVLQHDFFQHAWDRPLEAWLRRTVPGGGLVPAWLEFALLAPLLHDATDALNDGNGILRRLTEAEAEWFERR
jgi:hypothetical protein